MALTVKQHYVPRFYLKNFGNLIYCYDKKDDKLFKTNPKNVAFEPDFYGPDTKEIDSVEKIMSEMESKMSIAVSELIKKENYYELQPKLQKQIVIFLAIQFLRTKQLRQDIASISNCIIGEYLASKGQKKDAAKLSKLGELKQHLNLLVDYPAYATIIGRMKFCLVVNRTPIPIWTSDNPVSQQNELDSHGWGNMGLTCRGIEIHLPLTPRLGLVAMDPTVFGEIPNRFEVYNKQHIIRENFLQVISSNRFVFSNTRKFRLLKKMLNTNKDLKNPKKTRVAFSKGHIGNKEYLMTSTENRQFSPTNNITGPLDTWMSIESVEKIFKMHKESSKKL